MASVSTGQSTSNSRSTSNSVIPNYPQSPFLQAIAQYAGQVGSNVYNWAQGEYAKNSSLTDANIHNYLNTSASALGLAQNDANRYQNKFQPQEDQLIADANSYASPNRVKLEMGQAESGQMQGNEAAIANHKRDLDSYGVDPSAGRYAGLDEAARVSGAAAAVGAGQQARQNTEAVGRDLRDKSIAVGAQYPGRIINAMNTGLQGFAGAENAGLANANTGVALMGAANPFLNTASSLKYPPLGTDSQSSSTGQSTQNSNSTDPAQQQKNPSTPSDKGSGSGSGSGNPGTGTGPGSPGGINPMPAGPSEDGNDGTWDGSGTNGDGDNVPIDSTGGFGEPSDGTNWDGGISVEPSDYGPGTEMGGGDTYGGGDWGDYGGGDSGGDYGYFAQGGAIDDGDGDEGAIPQSASPSGGQQTDDVPATGPGGRPLRMNANEFVIPQDVALWKGQEFFQKLIAQSRQARVMAPARPQAKPAQGMR